jgi:putative ABC transport system permease protein
LGILGTDLLFDPAIAKLAHLTPSLVLLTVLVAICATVIAALYPAWRAAHVQPSLQLKSQ